MQVNKDWLPSRNGLLYVVQQCAFADFAGSGYRFFRDERGRVVHFWTRKGAQKFADELNRKQELSREPE